MLNGSSRNLTPGTKCCRESHVAEIPFGRACRRVICEILRFIPSICSIKLNTWFILHSIVSKYPLNRFQKENTSFWSCHFTQTNGRDSENHLNDCNDSRVRDSRGIDVFFFKVGWKNHGGKSEKSPFYQSYYTWKFVTTSMLYRNTDFVVYRGYYQL